MSAPDLPDRDADWAETPELVVRMLYRLLLDREPDPGGFSHYVSVLRSNRLTAHQLARKFVESDEFQHRDPTRVHMATVTALGCRFILPAGSVAAAEIGSPAGYEPWVLPYFLERCRPGMTVLDVGASWGAFALPAAARVGPSGRVIAIEVSPRNCAILMRSIEANGFGNIDVLPLGLSDCLGPEILERQTFTNNNAIETDRRPPPGDWDRFDIVPVMPFDLLRSALGPVQLVKMDIEGMEYRAARGAAGFLREQRPTVFVEYSPEFQKIGSRARGADLLGLFLDLGYAVEILHRSQPRERLRQLARSAAIERVDAAWRRHVAEEGGTHLDLCLHPSRP